jgi:hypothetical protein
VSSVWNEVEACLRQLPSAFAPQHHLQLIAQLVQPEHVCGRILELLSRKRLGTPVRTLLFLREFDSQQLTAKVLQTVSIGISADELGSDFCAVNRSAHHAQPTAQHADIEAGEMKQLGHPLVDEQALEIGGLIESRRAAAARRKMHEMADAVASRQLDKAQSVTMRMKPSGFRIDGDGLAEQQVRGKISTMQLYVHRVLRQWSDGANRKIAHLVVIAGGDGAQEKTRTSTASRPQVPETCASTNSATWARIFIRSSRQQWYEYGSPTVKTFSLPEAIRTVVDDIQLG